MTFLKLSRSIINTRYIKSIDFSNKKYIIHTIDQIHGGYFFFGFGLFESENSTKVVCSQKDPEDYISIQTWINSLGQHKPWSYKSDGKNTSTFVPPLKVRNVE